MRCGRRSTSTTTSWRPHASLRSANAARSARSSRSWRAGDSHVHHARMRSWFSANSAAGWATCPITESGFVRVSSNPKVLPGAIGVEPERAVLSALREADGHRFLVDDVSIADEDIPALVGHRQVTDAHL